MTAARPPVHIQSGPALLLTYGLKMPSTNEKNVPTITPNATRSLPIEAVLKHALYPRIIFAYRDLVALQNSRQERPTPMLKTTIAGSLPKPEWLAEPKKLWPTWRGAGAELERAKRDATLLWLKEQEDAGIDIVTDGEQSRQHFVHGFLEFVDGIDFGRKVKMGIRNN